MFPKIIASIIAIYPIVANNTISYQLEQTKLSKSTLAEYFIHTEGRNETHTVVEKEHPTETIDTHT